MHVQDIYQRLGTLAAGPKLVVLTGGNPALYSLDPLVERLHADGYRVAVETQGSVWRPWLAHVDTLVVSPKPPSSGMDSERTRVQFARFMKLAGSAKGEAALKVVVFNEADVQFSEALAECYPAWPFYVSLGTDVGTESLDTQRLLERYRWLWGRIACSSALSNAHLFPQLHVMAWGTQQGV